MYSETNLNVSPQLEFRLQGAGGGGQPEFQRQRAPVAAERLARELGRVLQYVSLRGHFASQ